MSSRRESEGRLQLFTAENRQRGEAGEVDLESFEQPLLDLRVAARARRKGQFSGFSVPQCDRPRQ